MNFWIRNIATVHSGYSHPGPIRHVQWGSYNIIQSGDAWPGLIDQTSDFTRISLRKIKDHQILRVGDLIFRPYAGSPLTLLIEKHLTQTICINPLMVIRLYNPHEVLPAFVNWYINLPATQKEIAGFANGKKSGRISIRAIERLELPVPALAVQQLIVAEDAKTRQALQGAPWEQEALAQANAILLELVGDERRQAANECV
jgi:hypothetical protein